MFFKGIKNEKLKTLTNDIRSSRRNGKNIALEGISRKKARFGKLCNFWNKRPTLKFELA